MSDWFRTQLHLWRRLREPKIVLGTLMTDTHHLSPTPNSELTIDALRMKSSFT